MLKVGGIYVSPIEVESALIAHPAVHETAVVGKEDSDRLVKPIAYVVLARGFLASEALAGELKAFVKSRLPPDKYPRRVDILARPPQTATGQNPPAQVGEPSQTSKLNSQNLQPNDLFPGPA